MQRLEVSGAVRPIYESLGVKRLIYTPFCVNSLKYYSFYLILNSTISFEVPSLYQARTSVNRHTYIHKATYLMTIYTCFLGEDFASAVEIKGNRSAMNSADFTAIGAVSYVAILQDISTNFLSILWN